MCDCLSARLLIRGLQGEPAGTGNSSKLRTERVSSSKQGIGYRLVSMHIAWGELFAPACRKDLKPEQRKSGDLMHSSLCTPMPLALERCRYQGGFRDTGMDLIKVRNGRGGDDDKEEVMPEGNSQVTKQRPNPTLEDLCG